MTYFGSSLRRAACLSLSAFVLSAGCMAPGPVDGTWLDPPQDTNFNNPNNWTSKAVPNNVATIPRNDSFPPESYIDPSRGTTVVNAIRHSNGKYLFLMDPGENVTFQDPQGRPGEGLTVCCFAGM